jgi:hypothetical protein
VSDSSVDIVFMPYTQMFLALPDFGNAFAEYPNVERWWKGISSRPSWQKILNLK